MQGKLIGLIAGGVAVVVAVVVLATSGGDSDAPVTPTGVVQSATSATPDSTLPTVETTVLEQATSLAPEAIACASTQEPHIVATGLVTTIDGVPIAPQGQYEGIWFSHGNAVSITVPEAGGPVLVNIATVIATDQGQFQTYTIGHDSRGAYPPPDVRTPENYAAFDASANTLTGSVGVAIEAIEAGEVATTNPSIFISSGIEATFTGAAMEGAVAHPDLDIVFVADMIERRDLPVFSSPECYQAAVESAGE